MKFPVAIFSVLASLCALAGSYATGGEVSLDIVGADTYAVHVFTNNGDFVVKGAGLDADILIVGGGGGGGAFHGGGGGAGGFVYTNSVRLAPGSHGVAVGAGGQGSSVVNSWGGNGGDSTFAVAADDVLTAFGGGGGAAASNALGSSKPGASGASGGGGGVCFITTAVVEADGGTGIPGQGYRGGRGFNNETGNHFRQWGGGGGGAGGPGGDAWWNSDSDSGSGTGGVGRVCAITGKEVWYAGGGSGGGEKNVGSQDPGLGGGGKGGKASSSTSFTDATDGVDGLGGGGGGGWSAYEGNNTYVGKGGNGLGKTHLMHAIGQKVLERDDDKKVVYLSTEAFTNDFINMVRTQRAHEFRTRYRNADILLIDDIQFLTGKEGTQEEFFHTFNALHDAGKQIVISSDRAPDEIERLEERLVTRFKGGLLIDIQPPDLETRCAILQRKAIQENAAITDDVFFFIADKITSNIRELEGALNKVISYARLYRVEQIDLLVAKEALRGLLPEDAPPKLTTALIQKTVADFYQLAAEDLKGKKKDRFISHPRQIAMYLCREHLGSSLPQIGRDFGGRDHSTVIHACEKIAAERAENFNLHQDISQIESMLGCKRR